MKKHALLLTTLTLASAGLFAADVKPADLEGKWIADNGKDPAHSFIFEARGDKLTGVTCGPCDPAHVFVIEDGSVTGDKIKFYIVHEDRGEGVAKFGPYRDEVTGTVTTNEIHIEWHRDGGSASEAPHGQMVLVGPVRLDVQPARPAPAAPAAPAK